MTKKTETAEKQKPLFSKRLGGVELTAWPNSAENGPVHRITISRSYKDKTDVWQTTTSFGPRDLDAVIQLIGDYRKEFGKAE